MPFLDVSELMTDMDFAQTNLICNRTKQVVGEDGLAVNTPVRIRFTGVVTAVRGFELERNAVGELITGTILICTRFRLTDGKAPTMQGPALTADTIQMGPRSYTVTNVYDYSKYGRGFIEAVCELLPLEGTRPGAYDPPECP